MFIGSPVLGCALMCVNGARLDTGHSRPGLAVTVELLALPECSVVRAVLITGRQRSRGRALHCDNEVLLADLREMLIPCRVVVQTRVERDRTTSGESSSELCHGAHIR